MTGRSTWALVCASLLVGHQLRTHVDRTTRRAIAAEVRADAVRAALNEALAPDGQFLAVVIAALDEAESLGSVLAAIPLEAAGLPVLRVVVDDGSTDKTAEVAEAGGAIVARHSRNLGQGDGLRTGFAVALRLGAWAVVTMDADGQHDPAQLSDLIGPLLADEADYVQGSRFLSAGDYDDAGGARHVGILGFTWLLNTAAGTEITDATNGFRAVRADALEKLTLVEDRFSASEIIIEASARGLRMHEVPVVIRSRAVGESRKPRGLRYPVGYFGVVLRSWARNRLPAARGRWARA